MKASDFYRILSRVHGMRWELVPGAKPAFGVPSKTWFIRGERGSLFYDPLSAVASCVHRKGIPSKDKDSRRFVDRSSATNTILHLDQRTFRRIFDATHQCIDYSPAVRRKLLKACGLHLGSRPR